MPSTLKPGTTLLVEDIAYDVRHVLHRPLPGQEGPGETLLLAHCLSGPHASSPALVRRLEGAVDSPALRRIQDGGRLARRMAHPHITQVWQVHPEPETLSIVSEYIPGFDLETVASYCALLRRPPLTAFFCFVAAAMADALDYLHRLQDDLGRPLGVIHRGIGLANIRLGTGGEVKLSGFDGMFSLPFSSGRSNRTRGNATRRARSCATTCTHGSTAYRSRTAPMWRWRRCGICAIRPGRPRAGQTPWSGKSPRADGYSHEQA